MKIEILGKEFCGRKMGEGNSGDSYIICMCETVKVNNINTEKLIK